MVNQKNKKKLPKFFCRRKIKKVKKRLGIDIKIYLKKKKRKRVNIVRSKIKTSLKKKVKES